MSGHTSGRVDKMNKGWPGLGSQRLPISGWALRPLQGKAGASLEPFSLYSAHIYWVPGTVLGTHWVLSKCVMNNERKGA